MTSLSYFEQDLNFQPEVLPRLNILEGVLKNGSGGTNSYLKHQLWRMPGWPITFKKIKNMHCISFSLI